MLRGIAFTAAVLLASSLAHAEAPSYQESYGVTALVGGDGYIGAEMLFDGAFGVRAGRLDDTVCVRATKCGVCAEESEGEAEMVEGVAAMEFGAGWSVYGSVGFVDYALDDTITFGGGLRYGYGNAGLVAGWNTETDFVGGFGYRW